MIFDSSVKPFGTAPSGEVVHLIGLKNDTIACEIITYGAAIHSLWVPDREDKAVDVVLGCDTLEDHLKQKEYMGACVGRFANRIANSRFGLNGKEYVLTCNNGKHHLHGGLVGFSHRVWDIASVRPDCAELTLTRPDGDEGYPGTLQVNVTYSLCGGTLHIHYRAVSDADTPCSLTNHSFFNLAGHNAGSILDHEITVMADHFTPVNPECIPAGEISPVEGTLMDLRVPVQLGSRLEEARLQLKRSNGFDHNYVINGPPNTLRHAARAACGKTGICLQIDTTLPGVQLYTANAIAPNCTGKGGCTYRIHDALCLETQFYPDSPNTPSFPCAILKTGEVYDHVTTYQFSTF